MTNSQSDRGEGLPLETSDEARSAWSGDPLSLVDVRPPRLELPDGSSASLVGGAIEFRDARGILRVRFTGDEAEVLAPRDLTLRSEQGRVVIDAATDVVVSAARDVTQRAGRSVDVASAGGQRLQLGPRVARLVAKAVDVEAREGKLVLDAATVVARSLTTTAERIVEKAERVERLAERLVSRAQHALTEVADVCESRLGRVRTVVKGTFDLTTSRTALRSKEQTTIDGERILLG